MIALKFKISVPRSIARVVDQAAAASGGALVDAGDQPTELGDFASSSPVAATTYSAGKVPQWLQKVVERFPVEQLHRRLSATPSVPQAECAAKRTGQSAAAGDEIEWAIGDLERELELRAGLIREQWAIRGPGLLAALTRQNGFRLAAGELEVDLVLPLTGGDAGVDDSGNVWMEALLHDVSFQFPETLRVGWLVARSGSSSINAAVQLLLNAAAEVDWLSPDPATEAELRAGLGISSASPPVESSPQAAAGSETE